MKAPKGSSADEIALRRESERVRMMTGWEPILIMPGSLMLLYLPTRDMYKLVLVEDNPAKPPPNVFDGEQFRELVNYLGYAALHPMEMKNYDQHREEDDGKHGSSD